MNLSPETSQINEKPLTLIAFVSDVWEHACPTVRLSIPAKTTGINLVKGNQWVVEELQINLEYIPDIILIGPN